MWPIVHALLKDVLFVLATVLFLRFFVGHLSRVDGNSMLPTLQNKDWVLVWRFPYLFRAPKRQEVVICHYPGRRMKRCKWLPQHFVKRVIGLPGETVEHTEGEVHINSRPLYDPYLDPERRRYKRTRPVKELSPNEFYVMGDNRDRSNDSRSVGPIRRRAIRGQAVCIIWPPKRWQKIR